MGSQSFTHTRTIPAFTPRRQGVTALRLASTHSVYPRTDGQAELTRMVGHIPR